MTQPQIKTGKRSRGVIPLFIILFVAGFTIFVISQLFVSTVKEDTIFTVERGESFRQVAVVLEEKSIIPDGFSLRLFAKLTKKDSHIKAGSFSLRKGQSPVQVLNSLINDPPILAKVTIPEGFTAKQVTSRVKAELPSIEPLIAMIQKSRLPAEVIDHFVNNPPDSPEGYLYPDTYLYTDTKPEEVYIAMFRQLVTTLEDLYFTYPENPVASGVLSLHEAIILASVVEREALLDKERPIIAGVFLKRLQKDMYLQSCATVTYVLEKPVARLTYKDLEIDSPYNTYRYPGLPVGPIGNPGLQSLTAVFKPEFTEFLFFVAKGDGSHVFTRTYTEHLNAQTIHEEWLKQNSKE